MTRVSRASAEKKSLRRSRHFRKASAVILILSMMLPLALPIPAWAYSTRISAHQESNFRLTSPESSGNKGGAVPWLGGSVSEFASTLMKGPLALFASSENVKSSEKSLPKMADLEKRVADIETELTTENKIQVGNAISLAARPLDKDGRVINGIGAKWSCPDRGIIRMLGDSHAVAVAAGETTLSVKSGREVKRIIIRVGEPGADEGRTTSSLMDDPEIEQPVLTLDQAVNLVTPENNLGSPVGQSEMSSSFSGAAARTRERYGSSTYSFGIPVASLPGRGLDASIGITYNSRVWNKSLSGGTRVFSFNSNGNWLSPGFEIGFGEMISYGTSGGNGIAYLLTSPDGTRHQLTYKQASGNCAIYESNDGTFIQTTICGIYTTSSINVVYPDGTQVLYGATTGSGKRFPIRITDRNGNMLNIAYLQNDAQGKIAYIRDTLNRYINFHYDSTDDKKLVAVSVPGFDGSSTPRKTIRFYYDDLTLQTSGRFETPVQVNAPSSAINVLRYVYFPGTNSGYKYDYSPYFGTIYKISQRRGMTVSSDGTTETGSVTSEGTEAASTHYNYPAVAMELGPPLTDVPKYSWRKDDWLGRQGDIPQTSFFSERSVTPSGCEATNSCTGTNTLTVTSPDGIKRISVQKVNNGQWDDGLLTEARIEDSQEQVWSKTKMFWEQGANQPPGRANPRLSKIEATNDADQTRATSFEYDAYNNQTVVKEHDFDDPGELGTELRRTEIGYITESGWLSNRLLRLPQTIKTVVSGVTTSKTVYEYDNNGAALSSSNITLRPNIGSDVHDVRYNPDAPSGEACAPECNPPHRCCWNVPVYQPETRFRGNVTKITAFSDATLESDPDASVTTVRYDIAGNVVQSSSTCCELRTIEFVAGSHFAYPLSETRSGQGLSLTTSATYDLNTGLMLTATDENNQTTEVTYDPANLRATRTDTPNGAWTETEYNDTTFPYHVKQTASLDLDPARDVSSWSFSNGRGQTFRSRNQVSGGYLSSDVEFDIMGRPVRTFNPYTVANLADPRPGGIKFSQITGRDGLGRTLEMTLQDATTVTVEYGGLVVTVTDQAGKMRRQVADALGRTIRVDEPDASGQLGDIGSPNQPTFYEYDGNDNLKKVTQSDGTNTQERLFKYDSLSRLTHEKQVEASATLNDAGVRVGGSGTWTGVYKYDTNSLLEWGVDARGVKTSFTYDGLHRMESVSYTGETGYETPTVTYIYDEIESGFHNKGRLTKVKTDANAIYGTPETIQNYRYNKMGQVVRHTQSIGSESYLQEYGYNLAGQLTSQKYPSGRIIENEIDNFGRLAEVSDNQRIYVSGLTFNAQGMLSQINLGNGTQETYSYNDRFQMTSQSLMKSSTVLQKYEYGYGQIDGSGDLDTTRNNGQLGRIEGFIGANKQWTQKFSYDSIGRLKQAEERRGDNNSLTYKQVFDFDRFGNLYRKASSNPTTGQANPLLYTPIEDGDISKTTNRFTTDTTYDDAGQVVVDDKFREMGFAYDANGRQVKATKQNQPDAWTVYDALGNRVATKINGVWQLMVYDAFGKLVAEYGMASEATGGVKYIQQDWQGSVRTVSNSNGFVTARADHQAFGEDVGIGVGLRKVEQGYAADKATRQSYGLTENDQATGQQHTWFRKLETQAGRWTSPDPYNGSMTLSDPRSFNRYSYVANDPTNFVDPSGLDLIAICSFIGTITIGFDTTNPQTFDVYVCTIISMGGGPIFMPTGGGGGDGGGGGGGGASQSASDKCVEKLDAVLKTLLGEKAFGKLNNSETNTTGFLAHMANLLQAGRIIGVIGGLSNYNPDTGIITMNIDPSRGEGFPGAWAATQRLEFIHEGLHSAKPSSFSHQDIYRAMAAVDGLDFDKFTKDRKKQLKNQGARINDDSMYRDEMNRWIRQYCE